MNAQNLTPQIIPIGMRCIPQARLKALAEAIMTNGCPPPSFAQGHCPLYLFLVITARKNAAFTLPASGHSLFLTQFLSPPHPPLSWLFPLVLPEATSSVPVGSSFPSSLSRIHTLNRCGGVRFLCTSQSPVPPSPKERQRVLGLGHQPAALYTVPEEAHRTLWALDHLPVSISPARQAYATKLSSSMFGARSQGVFAPWVLD